MGVATWEMEAVVGVVAANLERAIGLVQVAVMSTTRDVPNAESAKPLDPQTQGPLPASRPSKCPKEIGCAWIRCMLVWATLTTQLRKCQLRAPNAMQPLRQGRPPPQRQFLDLIFIFLRPQVGGNDRGRSDTGGRPSRPGDWKCTKCGDKGGGSDKKDAGTSISNTDRRATCATRCIRTPPWTPAPGGGGGTLSAMRGTSSHSLTRSASVDFNFLNISDRAETSGAARRTRRSTTTLGGRKRRKTGGATTSEGRGGGGQGQGQGQGVAGGQGQGQGRVAEGAKAAGGGGRGRGQEGGGTSERE